MGELDEQQQLREGIILKSNAISDPASGDGEQLRKKPWFVVAVVVSKVLFEGQFGQQEGDFIGSVAFEVVKSVDTRLADDRGVLDCGGDVGG